MAGNMLKRAAVYVQTKGERHASEDVVYERPGVGKVIVPAIIGETVFSQDTQGGFVDRIVRRDYTIRQCLLVINCTHIGNPQRNDIIWQTLDDNSTYQGRVLGDAGMPHYQESDAFGVAWRIHTKRDEVTR